MKDQNIELPLPLPTTKDGSDTFVVGYHEDDEILRAWGRALIEADRQRRGEPAAWVSGNTAQPAASVEPLVRYCPGCGSIGPVEPEYRNCCPDGNQARMIPQALAEKCRDTFKVAIREMLAEQTANDAAPTPPAAAQAQQDADKVDADFDIDAAARTLAARMDYPWEQMPEQGKQEMRKHAQSVVAAARAQQGGQS